jgi:hypothetical protein
MLCFVCIGIIVINILLIDIGSIMKNDNYNDNNNSVQSHQLGALWSEVAISYYVIVSLCHCV